MPGMGGRLFIDEEENGKLWIFYTPREASALGR
jgi:hypothetical protein